MANWHLDEQAFTGEEHLDPAYVASYARKAGFDPAEDIEPAGARTSNLQ